MNLFEIRNHPIKNPFHSSQVPELLYHGTTAKFSKFLRPVHGIYVTPWRDWARSHYGDSIIVLYANVTKMYVIDPSSDESDPFYDMDYEAVAAMLEKLSQQGYDCCKFGGESDSMVLFNGIEIVNAYTGESM